MSEPSLIVSAAEDLGKITFGLDIFVCAAGFEERAFEVVSKGRFNKGAHCILICYKNSISENDKVLQRYMGQLEKKFNREKIHLVDLITKLASQFEREITAVFRQLPADAINIGIDVSGIASYAICLTLKAAREVRPYVKQTILYSSALEYTPTKREYEKLIELQGNDIDYLPPSMALEMSENLVLDSFSGYHSGDGKACLVVFAGYEVHRSTGTIEAINPSLLLLLYGSPGDSKLDWRLDLSKRLHSKFERTRRCGSEVVSTLQLREALDALEKYYNYLIDDYDLIVSPICSKMHTVAAYLFWERYGEVQLSFPLPIGYDPALAPKGVGQTYTVELYEPRMLFRGAGPA